MDFLSFLGKILPHADKLDDLLDAGGRIVSGANSLEKWEGVKAGGDIAVPIFHEVTGLSVAPFSCEADAVAYVSAQGLGDGKLLERLKALYDSPLFQMALQLWLASRK